ARQHPRIVVLEAAQAHTLDVVRDDAPALGGGRALLAQTEPDVLRDGEPGEEGVGLEDHAALGARSGHGLAIEEHAARGGAVGSGHDAQERRLAATVRAEQADEVVVGYAERGRLDGPGGP